MARTSVCIACGKPTGPHSKLNRLPNGKPCPSCAERILDDLPALLPKPSEDLDFQEWEEEGKPSESGEDDFLEGA